ncbi:unnamed protein product [Dicrocoelium dendriticum]|nr:unnamed protein product [Dicrocoelium dendriticum]
MTSVWTVTLLCFSFCSVALGQLSMDFFKPKCAQLGEACTRTPIKKCCDNTVCKLYYPLVGLCVPCYTKGAMCLNNEECCYGACFFNRCL